jgi:SAM-dependent methyltransferase
MPPGRAKSGALATARFALTPRGAPGFLARMSITEKYAREFALNRTSWNTRTPVHVRSRFYDVDAFLAGKDSLTSIDHDEVGDVRGKSLLHLQCHFGLDTMSWARRGARAVGLDLSEAAIAEAERLAARAGIDARFVCANVYDAEAATGGEPFDVVYTSYGVLGWLPELGPWARAVAACTKPGGVLHLIEFHPVRYMLDDAEELHLVYPYDSAGRAAEETQEGTYAERGADIRVTDCYWCHGIGTVLGALLDAGLVIERFAEFDWSPYDVFAHPVEFAPGRFRIAHLGDRLPYVFSVRARKPG